MYKIRTAKYTRIIERNNEKMAEVRVKVEGDDKHDLIAYFSKNRNGEFDMPVILENDADYTVDWYDNNMHKAIENHKIDENNRNQFYHDVLNYGNVKEEVATNLSNV